MISSLHHDAATNPENGKPEIISFYNGTKGGVDTLDQQCSNYSASRRTNRWPMSIFYALVGISSVNAYVLHQGYLDSSRMLRFNFVDVLATKLIEPHIKRRYDNPKINMELQFSIRRLLGITEEQAVDSKEGNAVQVVERSKRKRCYVCPSGKDRKTQTVCDNCKKPICMQCAIKKCKKLFVIKV